MFGEEKRKTRTVVIVAQPLPGELPHKEADDANHGNTASNRKTDDGGRRDARAAFTTRTFASG